MANWLTRAVGEISKLRQSITSFSGGSFITAYKLDTSRVDYEKARALYFNEDDKYKLGAGFAKPVINTTAAFMGVPTFKSEAPDAQEALDEFFPANISRMQQTQRDALRDGDCWVWITREEDEESKLLYPESDGARFVYNIIPPEQITEIVRNSLTGRPQKYILKSEHEWVNEKGEKKKCTLQQTITATERIIKVVDGTKPDDFDEGDGKNPWGFIPIVQFSNEKDSSSANGRSDLEAIEPFMKAYHDVMMQAIQGHKLHSTPKLKMKLKEVAAFLKNNFGVDDIKKFIEEGRKINLEGHDLLLFQDNEDAQFIEVQSAIGATEPLLKFIFYCIVDTSETPEFAFGVHTPSSLSSVKEQMPILVKKVSRKRENFSESWEMLARIYLAMRSAAEGKKYSTHATTLIWDEIDPRDDKDVAETLDKLVSALVKAVEWHIMSEEAAVNFLSQYVDTMNDYITDDEENPGEREKIIRDLIRRARLETGQFDEDENKAIDKALKETG